MVLLDAGTFVVNVKRGCDSFGDHPRAETARRIPLDTAIEDQLDFFRPPGVEVFSNHLFEENPATDGPVEHLRQRELGLQDRNVVDIPGLAVFGRKRMRQPLQPFFATAG